MTTSILGSFAQHRVAANLLMVIMLLSGVIALNKLNVQFFPNFELDLITVSTVWSGASSEDVEAGLTIPLEQRLRSIDRLKEMTSTSATGTSGITLEFDEDADISFALDEVEKQVDNFTNLPQDAEQPQVAQLVRYESVARLLISGPDQIEELRMLARQFESELIAAGIDKIEIRGLPKQQLQIEIGAEQMQRLGIGLDELANRIDQESQDLPAGLIGEEDGAREIRSKNQRRTPQDFASLAIVSEADKRIHLGDIAEVRERHLPGSPTISLDGKKAVVLVLRRNETATRWKPPRYWKLVAQKTRAQIPPNIQLQVFNECWQLIKERIMLLLKNGAGGLVLVVLILYVFLTGRVAFWVAVGIPVSFMATLCRSSTCRRQHQHDQPVRPDHGARHHRRRRHRGRRGRPGPLPDGRGAAAGRRRRRPAHAGAGDGLVAHHHCRLSAADAGGRASSAISCSTSRW